MRQTVIRQCAGSFYIAAGSREKNWCRAVLRIRSLRRRLLLVAITLIFAAPSPVRASKPISTIKFEYTKAGVILSATTNDKQVPFLFDTGTDRSIVDRALNQAIGAKAGTRTLLGSNTQLSVHKVDDLRIGGLNYPSDATIGVTHLHHLHYGRDRQILGILGCDFLKEYRWHIDFDAARLSIYKADLLQRVPINEAKQISLLKDPGFETRNVLANLPSGRKLMVLDTGTDAHALLNPESYRALEKTGDITTIGTAQTTQATSASSERLKVGLLKSLSVGNAVMRDVFVRQRAEAYSSLGLWFLERFNIMFDLRGGYLVMEKRSNNSSRFRMVEGMQIVGINDLIAVASVKEGSAAARANVHRGDLIRRLNGVRLAKLSIQSIRAALKKITRSAGSLQFQRNETTGAISIDVE